MTFLQICSLALRMCIEFQAHLDFGLQGGIITNIWKIKFWKENKECQRTWKLKYIKLYKGPWFVCHIGFECCAFGHRKDRRGWWGGGGGHGKLTLTSSIWKNKYSMIGIKLHSHTNVENQITYCNDHVPIYDNLVS